MIAFVSLAAVAVAAAAAAPAPAAVTCLTFDATPGLCPWAGLCQCTLGESCGAAAPAYGAEAAPRASARRLPDGSSQCAGRCLTIVPDQCPGPASCVASAGPCVAPPPCAPAPANNTARSVLLTLAHQGFADGHPGALVYVPTTFDRSAAPLSLVVFVHGFHNCVANCMLPEASACNCSWGGGGGTNQAYGLIDSFERAALASAAAGDAGPASPAQSLLVAVEVAYDQASADVGNWSQPGLFRAFLADLLASPALAPLAGAPRAPDDLARVRVFSHSGGYAVAAALAAAGNGGGGGGGLAAAFEIVLLDSLYGSEAQFDGFVEAALAAGALGPGAAQARFVSVYTDGGGTEANNRAMAARAAAWLRAANASALLYYNDALDAPLPPQAVADVAVIFKRSNLTHDDTCRQYFALFVAGMRYR